MTAAQAARLPGLTHPSTTTFRCSSSLSSASGGEPSSPRLPWLLSDSEPSGIWLMPTPAPQMPPAARPWSGAAAGSGERGGEGAMAAAAGRGGERTDSCCCSFQPPLATAGSRIMIAAGWERPGGDANLHGAKRAGKEGGVGSAAGGGLQRGAGCLRGLAAARQPVWRRSTWRGACLPTPRRARGEWGHLPFSTRAWPRAARRCCSLTKCLQGGHPGRGLGQAGLPAGRALARTFCSCLALHVQRRATLQRLPRAAKSISAATFRHVAPAAADWPDHRHPCLRRQSTF